MVKFLSANLFAAGLLFFSACAQGGALDSVWQNPLRADGRVFEATVYPFDYTQDRELYVMCTRQCTLAEAVDEPAVLIPASPGLYDGAQGTTPYRVRIMFHADCFHPESVCPHRQFVFQQLQ